jgi:hypothetical protein
VGRVEDFEVDLPPELLTRAATPGAAREQ